MTEPSRVAARPRLGALPGVRAAAFVFALFLSGCGAPEGEGDRVSGEAGEPGPGAATAAAAELDPLPSPATEGAGAFAPELARVAGEPALTWIEREPGSGRTRVRFARLGGADGGSPEPVTLVGDEDAERRPPMELFANWADRPGVVQGGPGGGESPDGPLFAWWLAKTGDSTYAYEVRVARSDDLGATWRPLGRLHDDPTPAEHGFVSMVPEGDGVRAFWLDGRATTEGRPMTLRTVRIGEEIERETEERLDRSVCDCCNTAAVVTDGAPVVFYRDRTGGEVRDHRAVRRVEDGGDDGGAGWSEPYVLSSDGWEIAACPVNGPAAAVAGDTVWAAWFTAADGRPRVHAARSTDGGRSFSEPLTVDDGSTASGGGSPPLGRLALVAAGPGGDGDAWVSWFGTAPAASDGNGDGAGKNVAVLRARRLSAEGPNPVMGPVVEIARTDSSRASGVPRMLYDPAPEGAGGGRLLFAWVEPAGDGERSDLRLARVPVAEVPR